LKNLWAVAAGEACAFLVDEKCSIYEARPLICRTQGLAFKYKHDEKDLIDICPLNEEMLDVLTTKEVLNLDLLNTILSQMERAHPSRGPRQLLRDLREELKNL
jgi:Fe-S-cluster containining protein